MGGRIVACLTAVACAPFARGPVGCNFCSVSIRRAFFSAALALAFVIAAAPAGARKLYAATAHDDPVAGESGGFLYVVDPGTGKSKAVGPIRVDGRIPVAVDGLAVDPKTRLLYGI